MGSGILMHGGLIVTMDEKCQVYGDGAVFVNADKIHAIGHSSQILEQYSSLAVHIINLEGRIILPGGTEREMWTRNGTVSTTGQATRSQNGR